MTPSPVEANNHPARSMALRLNLLEEHAAAMASLLESLVDHYDRCSLALKIAEPHDSSSATQEANDESVEDKANMLQVLEKDAAQVDDVVSEIKERLDEVEVVGIAVEKELHELYSLYRSILDILAQVQQSHCELVSCAQQSKDFVVRQRDNQETISERLYGLQQLSRHYTLFRESYDALLIEVNRRCDVQRQKNAVITDAMAKIDALNEGMLFLQKA